jgi:hypothetical protein
MSSRKRKYSPLTKEERARRKVQLEKERDDKRRLDELEYDREEQPLKKGDLIEWTVDFSTDNQTWGLHYFEYRSKEIANPDPKHPLTYHVGDSMWAYENEELVGKGVRFYFSGGYSNIGNNELVANWKAVIPSNAKYIRLRMRRANTHTCSDCDEEHTSTDVETMTLDIDNKKWIDCDDRISGLVDDLFIAKYAAYPEFRLITKITLTCPYDQLNSHL